MSETQGSRFNKFTSQWWKPENVGDQIGGTLVRVYEETGQSGDEYPVLVLDTPDEGERRVRASQYDLKAQLAKEDPSDGDYLELELTGFEQVAKGKMKRFSVEVTPNGEAF